MEVVNGLPPASTPAKFSLPRASHAEHEPLAPTESRRMRVLVAEDDREMRRLLVSTLRRERCEVIEVGTGSQLWEIISSAEFGTRPDASVDLIISDVRMPGKSGLEVLSVLHASHRATPVILITGFGDIETHAEAQRLGALAVFNKPFDLDDLRTIVVHLRNARVQFADAMP
jgi:DNA-binding NtrC family response regulator